MSIIDLLVDLCLEHPDFVKSARANLKEKEKTHSHYYLWSDWVGPCDDGTYVWVPLTRKVPEGEGWLARVTTVTSVAFLEPADVERIHEQARSLIAKGKGRTRPEVLTSLGLGDALKKR